MNEEVRELVVHQQDVKEGPKVVEAGAESFWPLASARWEGLRQMEDYSRETASATDSKWMANHSFSELK